MSSNPGKIFEQQFCKSVPDYAWVHRLTDPPQSFNQDEAKSKGLRFSLKNPFDYILWDSKHWLFYALELKTVKGKSISFERTKEEKGEIHFHQIEGLKEVHTYAGTVSGIIVEFRQLEKTVFVDIAEFCRLMDIIPKKSFNYNDLDNYDILYTVIEQTKARTRYTYGIDEFLSMKKKEVGGIESEV